MTTKCNLRMISAVLVVLLLTASAQAQTGDWQAVQNLKAGTRISVKAQKRYVCSLEHATPDELVCEAVLPRLTRQPSRISIPRGAIREVRLEPSQTKSGLIGAGIGAGVGAAVGASSGTGSRGAGAFVGALGGAALGGLVGTIVPIFRRGKVIYKG